MTDALFVQIKLSDTQADLLKTAAWPGNTTHNVWSGTRTRRDSFRVLHALGLTTNPQFGARLTHDGLDVAKQIQDDPDLRAFDIPARGMVKTTAQRMAGQLDGVAVRAHRNAANGRWITDSLTGHRWVVVSKDRTTILDSGPATPVVNYAGPENEGVDW
ncbi:hypothetical protein JK364_23925 [Streptomyces sp. 110]|uniref:Uncharacterized protein n=1 Tax=Streptomyces endocoffeicus TaxID=2898945 RepID=A0ABS1PSN0_9ACTN|nr:hypothetical protein [Streptomyces endocoffeicus]MBL1115423.1 hypothetical protein [Streptomyces endocoffeicus]